MSGLEVLAQSANESGPRVNLYISAMDSPRHAGRSETVSAPPAMDDNLTKPTIPDATSRPKVGRDIGGEQPPAG